jgi:molybdopterin/thiamine biosynthesis adenylyltransferase
MTYLTNFLRTHRVPADETVELQFFRLSNPEDRSRMEQLCAEHPDLRVYDEIYSQLCDLVKLENPKESYTDSVISNSVEKKLNGLSLMDYGVWVYYPWRRALLHTLDKDDFISARTIRNAFKIDFKEQAILSTKKIGIVGLSVGQSVALAMAMERIGGSFVIADFDHLELSNLNRIRTPCLNLGLKKTVVVAREILEIDPFIQVNCFNSGLNQNNMGNFFDIFGGIDLVVEECDSIDIKFFIRDIARNRGIPVLMSTSDKSMLDIERFDYDRSYPFFHGLTPDVDLEKLKKLKTSKEKLPFLLPIIGSDTLSKRLKASALELGKSITTWPQLATDVILDGAVCGHVARRILLGENIQSGRHWIDLNVLIPTERKEEPMNMEFKLEGKLDLKKATSQIPQRLISGVELNKEEVEFIVEHAILAPSPGNQQKWKWIYSDGFLNCYIDKSVSYSLSDNLDWGSLLALGCSIKNVVLAAGHIGYSCTTHHNQINEYFLPIVSIEFVIDKSIIEDNLFRYIKGRRVYRGIEPEVSNIPRELELIHNELFKNNSIRSSIITDRVLIDEISGLVSECEKLRFLNKLGHYELFNHEVRWTEEEINEKKTGLNILHFNFDALDMAGLRLISDDSAREVLVSIEGGDALKDLSLNYFKTADALIVVVIPEFNAYNIIESGKMIQEFWLNCEAYNVGMHPMTALQALSTFTIDNENKILSNEEVSKIISIEEKFNELMKITGHEASIFLARVKAIESQRFAVPRLGVDDKLKII